MPTSTLTSKGQITLPKAVRQRLRVHAGDVVEFVIGADGDIRVRAGSVDVSALRGMLQKTGRRPVTVERMHDVVRKAAGRS
jgi:AbrB family looped-hinge helix DNA binding protein